MHPRLPLLCAALFAALPARSVAQSSQTLPAGFDSLQGASATAFPFNQSTNHKWQWHYANSNFAQTGPIQINEIYIRASTVGQTVGPFDFPSVTVTCSEATTGYSVGLHDPVFANNLGANTQVVRSGPWAGGAVPPSGGATATWIPFGVTTPFVFDPTGGADFIIQIEKCGTLLPFGASIDGKSGTAGLNGGNRYGSTSDCAASVHSFNNNEYVPIVRIDYTDAGSAPTVYCTAGVTSSGCLPSIGFTGAPSATAPAGFDIDVASVDAQRQGLIFYGLDNTGFTPAPWGSGFFCVKPPTQRFAPQNSGGTLGGCDGSLSVDWNDYRFNAPTALGQPFVVGQRVFLQGWFRDPLSVKTSAFTNALEFAVGP